MNQKTKKEIREEGRTPCMYCGKAIDLTKKHVTIDERVERDHYSTKEGNWVSDVEAARVLAFLHLKCSSKLPRKELFCYPNGIVEEHFRYDDFTMFQKLKGVAKIKTKTK